MAANRTLRPIEWFGTTYRILLTSEQTGSRIGLFESLSQPGFGPPRHIHSHEDETFYIQSGEVEFWVKDETVIKGPGSVNFIPRGTEHAFRVLGDLPARTLTIMTPGGFEGLFIEMARKNYRTPEDTAEIAAAAARFNLTFTGPPLGTAPHANTGHDGLRQPKGGLHEAE